MRKIDEDKSFQYKTEHSIMVMAANIYKKNMD